MLHFPGLFIVAVSTAMYLEGANAKLLGYTENKKSTKICFSLGCSQAFKIIQSIYLSISLLKNHLKSSSGSEAISIIICGNMNLFVYFFDSFSYSLPGQVTVHWFSSHFKLEYTADSRDGKFPLCKTGLPSPAQTTSHHSVRCHLLFNIIYRSFSCRKKCGRREARTQGVVPLLELLPLDQVFWWCIQQ